MRYGYFDDEKREYVIDRPDTPAPWANYLGSPEYGAVISNNAGGRNLAQMVEFSGIFLMTLTALADIFISVIMTARITGLHPGSRLGRIWILIKVSAVMGRHIPKCLRITAISIPKHCIMCRWTKSMRFGA